MLVAESEATRQDGRTHLPTRIRLILCDRGTSYCNSPGPRRCIFKRDGVTHILKGQRQAICRTDSVHKDIAFARDPKHHSPFLRSLTGVQAMLPQATGGGIMHVQVCEVTRDGERLTPPR